MPTFFKAQNGLEIHRNTAVSVTGCTKHKKAKKHKRAEHRKHKRKH